MGAIAVHAIALLGDTFLHPSVLDVTVPFVFSYKTLSTSLGIIAGCIGTYLLARTLTGGRRDAALLAVVVFALAPYPYFLSLYGRASVPEGHGAELSRMSRGSGSCSSMVLTHLQHCPGA